jgi:hypothetical protein
MAGVAAGKLTQAWAKASAALPLEWELKGVIQAPREVDPVIRSSSWLAFARGPNGERAEGTGSDPIQALLALAESLAKIRRDMNG